MCIRDRAGVRRAYAAEAVALARQMDSARLIAYALRNHCLLYTSRCV